MRAMITALMLSLVSLPSATGALGEGPGYDAPPPYMDPGPRRHYGAHPPWHVQPQAHPYARPHAQRRGYGYGPPYGRAHGYYRHHPGW
jgi:hypothetical protein